MSHDLSVTDDHQINGRPWSEATREELAASISEALDSVGREIGGRLSSTVAASAKAIKRLLRALRFRPRRSRQLRSSRRRQELRTWARLTGGRLRVSGSPLGTEGARWPSSLGPATVADAQAFTTWQATRRRWGLVPDAVPREQSINVWVDPRPTPEQGP